MIDSTEQLEINRRLSAALSEVGFQTIDSKERLERQASLLNKISIGLDLGYLDLDEIEREVLSRLPTIAVEDFGLSWVEAETGVG